jgi:hypothetical protein
VIRNQRSTRFADGFFASGTIAYGRSMRVHINIIEGVIDMHAARQTVRREYRTYLGTSCLIPETRLAHYLPQSLWCRYFKQSHNIRTLKSHSGGLKLCWTPTDLKVLHAVPQQREHCQQKTRGSNWQKKKKQTT